MPSGMTVNPEAEGDGPEGANVNGASSPARYEIRIEGVPGPGRWAAWSGDLQVTANGGETAGWPGPGC